MAILESMILEGNLSRLLSFFAVILLLFCFICFWNKYLLPLRKVPGPYLASCTRLWKTYHVMRGNMETIQQDIHHRYGPVVRIGPNEVSTSEITALKTIYGITSGYHKTNFYTPFGVPAGDDLFSDQNEARHAFNRRQVASSYSMTSLIELEESMNRVSGLFCDRLKTWFAEPKRPIDLAYWLQFYAFDIIGEITFSKMFGFLSEGIDVAGSIASLEQFLCVGALFTCIPEVWPLYYEIVSLFARMGVCQKPGVGCIIDFSVKHSQERLARNDTSRPDMFGRFLTMGYSEPLILRMALTNVSAGSDTTAISLRSVLYFLMKNPTAYRTLQREIDAKAAAGKLSDPVSFAEAANLPYLQAVIKESMRLHPAVGLTLPRHVPRGGLTLCGFYLPAGTVIGANAYVIHRSPTVFGDDAEVFRPERWLEDDVRARDMDRHMMQFGLGSRVCLGKNLALLEMSKLVPQLLLNFRFRLVYPEKSWDTTNYWFVKQSDMDCWVDKRQSLF